MLLQFKLNYWTSDGYLIDYVSKEHRIMFYLNVIVLNFSLLAFQSSVKLFNFKLTVTCINIERTTEEIG